MKQPKNFFPAFNPTFTILVFAGILWWQFFLVAAVDEFEVEIDWAIIELELKEDLKWYHKLQIIQ